MGLRGGHCPQWAVTALRLGFQGMQSCVESTGLHRGVKDWDLAQSRRETRWNQSDGAFVLLPTSEPLIFVLHKLQYPPKHMLPVKELLSSEDY